MPTVAASGTEHQTPFIEGHRKLMDQHLVQRPPTAAPLPEGLYWKYTNTQTHLARALHHFAREKHISLTIDEYTHNIEGTFSKTSQANIQFP